MDPTAMSNCRLYVSFSLLVGISTDQNNAQTCISLEVPMVFLGNQALLPKLKNKFVYENLI